MPIYTKKGDRGQTGLPGDRRLPKTDQLFETLGFFDQTSAAIGVAVSQLDGKKDQALINQLQGVQSIFLSLGSCLASETPDQAEILPKLAAETLRLEAQIDEWDELLPPLRNFILAGGTPVAAALHVARSSSRFAERQFHRLSKVAGLEPIGQYLNRLSDYLFQAARFANHQAGQADIIWK